MQEEIAVPDGANTMLRNDGMRLEWLSERVTERRRRSLFAGQKDLSLSVKKKILREGNRS